MIVCWFQEELDFRLGENGDEAYAIKSLKKVVQWSVKTNHPGFVNQLYGGNDFFGLAGELMAVFLNTNQLVLNIILNKSYNLLLGKLIFYPIDGNLVVVLYFYIFR